MSTTKHKKRSRQLTDEEKRQLSLQHLYVMLLDAWTLYRWTVDTTDVEYALARLHEEERKYRAEFRPRSNQETNALELVRYFTLATLDHECFGDYVYGAYKRAQEAVASILKSAGARGGDCDNTHGSRVEKAVQ